MMKPCVYILASKPYGRLYIGVTSDLLQREFDHHRDLYPNSHTSQYGIKRLVWFDDGFDSMLDAIQREKTMKKWRRQWKVDLIEKHNPHWHRVHSETGEFVCDQ